jgi:ABC-2 type transport system permease protein
VLIKRGATALIAALAVWLFITIFIPLIATGIANAVASPLTQSSTIEQYVKWFGIHDPITYISPSTLYGETIQSLLLPDLNNVSVMLVVQGGIDYASNLMPLPLLESVLNVWPQIITLIALSVICFAGSYIRFQREEIRST